MPKARKIRTLLGTAPNKITSFEDYFGLVYARVSSKRQEIEGTGLESQEGRCKSELNAMGVPFERTFPDSYTGGGDFMKRPAMRELLDYIDARPHKKFVVIFDDLKRFARDTEFHLKLRSTFKVREVILKCLNYTFDESPEGRFAELIMAGQAELERHQNTRQVVQKQKARLEGGYWAFGRKKGYTQTKFPEHGMLCVPNKDGLEILKPALEDFASGVLLRKVDVARRLVEKDFWTKQKPEKYIDKVDKFLKDPFNAGFVEYPDWEVGRRVGKHQSLISIETFQLIQKRLSKIDYNKRIRISTSPDFPLRGLIKCADCGGHLTAAWTNGRNKRHPYYLCHTTGCKSYGKVIPKKLAEDKFDELLQKHTLKDNVDALVKKMFDKAWGAEVKSFQQREAVLGKQKKDLEAKVSDLTEMARTAKSAVLKRTYEQHLEAAAKQLEDLGAKPLSEIDLTIPYRTALDKAVGLLKNPYSIWKNLDVMGKQGLYYFIFEEKLPFSKTDGYRTAEIPCAIRLFEEFAGQKPPMVEMGEVKSPSRNFSLSNCSQD